MPVCINAGSHRCRKSHRFGQQGDLVVAGELVTKRAQAKAVNIYPVDSEHSAIFNVLWVNGTIPSRRSR